MTLTLTRIIPNSQKCEICGISIPNKTCLGVRIDTNYYFCNEHTLTVVETRIMELTEKYNQTKGISEGAD